MENVTSVTDFLRARAHDPRGVLTLVKTTGGASYLHAEDGYWRVCDFAEDTLCLQQPETDEDFTRAPWASAPSSSCFPISGGNAP